MTSVLLTGFEPFAGAPVNPSWDAVEAVGSSWRGDAAGRTGIELTVRRLPVEFVRASTMLAAWIEEIRPDVVIATGVAEGRTDVTVERVAINLDDASIPDNAGDRPVDSPVVPGADAAFFSTLPVKEIVAAIRAKGVPASVSLSAGSYVCNHVFYALQHALRASGALSGFVHVPASPEMNLAPEVPTLPVARTAEALAVAVEVTGAHRAPR